RPAVSRQVWGAGRLHAAGLRAPAAVSLHLEGMNRRRLLSSATVSALALGLDRPARAADLDVVIIGAGVAGLAAARTLLAAHKNVLVVEARERIGGRAVTDSTTFS